MAKKDNGNATASDEAIGEAFATVANELGVGDLPPAVADYAPPNDPQRMERTAELAAAAMRHAYDAAAQSARDMAADVKRVADHVCAEAEELAVNTIKYGNAHATRMEQTMLGMKGTSTIIAAERLKIAEHEANV